jgi:hypothetical protein
MTNPVSTLIGVLAGFSRNLGGPVVSVERKRFWGETRGADRSVTAAAHPVFGYRTHGRGCQKPSRPWLLLVEVTE